MADREEKEIKGIQTGKEVTILVYRWYDVIHRNPKDVTRKLIELISAEVFNLLA